MPDVALSAWYVLVNKIDKNSSFKYVYILKLSSFWRSK